MRAALLLLGLLGACYPSYSFDLAEPDEGAGGQAGSAPAGGQAGEGGASAGGTGGLAGSAGQGEGGASGGASGGAAGGAAVGVLDSFEEEGKLMQSWSGDSGSFAVSGGQLVVQGDGALVWSQSFGGQQWASVRVAQVGGGEVGLVLRRQEGKCDRLVVGYAAGVVRAWTCKNKKETTLGSVSVGLVDGDVLGARLAAGGTIVVLRNGQPVGTLQDEGPSGGGQIGIYASGATGARLDDFGGG